MSPFQRQPGAEVFPDVPVTKELGEHETLLSIDKAQAAARVTNPTQLAATTTRTAPRPRRTERASPGFTSVSDPGDAARRRAAAGRRRRGRSRLPGLRPRCAVWCAGPDGAHFLGGLLARSCSWPRGPHLPRPRWMALATSTCSCSASWWGRCGIRPCSVRPVRTSATRLCSWENMGFPEALSTAAWNSMSSRRNSSWSPRWPAAQSRAAWETRSLPASQDARSAASRAACGSIAPRSSFSACSCSSRLDEASRQRMTCGIVEVPGILRAAPPCPAAAVTPAFPWRTAPGWPP